MVIFRGKRGAIELSMNTIIIVVIGITILVLGLRWIYGIFGGLEEQQQQLERLTNEKIIELFGESDDAINLPTSFIKVSQGKKHNLRVIMRNIWGETHNFKYIMEADSIPKSIQSSVVMQNINWYKKDIKLNSGAGFQDYISIDTKNFPLGVYRFRAKITCLDCSPQEEESLPIILEVTAK